MEFLIIHALHSDVKISAQTISAWVKTHVFRLSYINTITFSFFSLPFPSLSLFLSHTISFFFFSPLPVSHHHRLTFVPLVFRILSSLFCFFHHPSISLCMFLFIFFHLSSPSVDFNLDLGHHPLISPFFCHPPSPSLPLSFHHHSLCLHSVSLSNVLICLSPSFYSSTSPFLHSRQHFTARPSLCLSILWSSILLSFSLSPSLPLSPLHSHSPHPRFTV